MVFPEGTKPVFPFLVDAVGRNETNTKGGRKEYTPTKQEVFSTPCDAILTASYWALPSTLAFFSLSQQSAILFISLLLQYAAFCLK